MSNFGLDIPQYNGPQYYEVREQMKKEAPGAYNALQIAVAKSRNPHSEVVRYTNAEGKEVTSTNTGAGYLSGTDPVARDIVAGVALNKPLQWVGSKVVDAGKKLLRRNQVTHDLTETELDELLSRLHRRRLSEEEKINIVSKASDEFFDYIGSEEHLAQIMKSGKSREEAQRIADAMYANARWSNIGMSPNFIEFTDNLPPQIAGRTYTRKSLLVDENGREIPDLTIVLNNNIHSPALIRETIQHELGHASTLGYNPSSRLSKMLETFSPEVKEIYNHNSSLLPVRKKIYTNNTDAKLEKILKYLENVDEYSTRARNSLVNDDNWDVNILYKYFTKRSVDNLINNVWGLAPVIGVVPSVIGDE